MKHKILNIFFNLLLISLITYNINFLFNVLSYSFCFADDYSIVSDTNYNIFISPICGLYFPSILDRIFAYIIPNSLDIHPSDFKSTYFKYIEIFIILLSAYIFSNVININKNKNINSFLICFTFAFSFILFKLKDYIILWFFTYEGLFRMFLPTFLFILLFYFLNKEKIKTKDKIITTILCLICTTSNEMIAITTTLGLFFYSILSLKLKQYNNFKCNILYLLTSLTGLSVLLNTGVFLRKTNSSINIDYFYNLLSFIPEFLQKYVSYIFIGHWFEFTILSILIFLIFKLKPTNKTKNKIMYILSFLFAVWSFFFLLICLGKTHYYGDEFWIIHPDLHYIYSFILYSFIFSLLSTFSQNIKYLNNIINILFLALSTFFSYANNISYNSTMETEIKPQRIESYKAEKIIRLANLKNKNAIINQNLYNYCYAWEFFEGFIFNQREKSRKVNTFTIFHNQFKKKIDIGYSFADEEAVEKEFKNNGGIFTEEELNDIKFTRLLDDNFLLNKKN